jgi:hypothetical protein
MNKNPEDSNSDLIQYKVPQKFDLTSQKHRSFPDLRILTSSALSTSSENYLSQTEKNEISSLSKYPKLGKNQHFTTKREYLNENPSYLIFSETDRPQKPTIWKNFHSYLWSEITGGYLDKDKENRFLQIQEDVYNFINVPFEFEKVLTTQKSRKRDKEK